MRIVLSTFQTKDNLPSPHSHPPRFRRDVLEGTLEEMLATARCGQSSTTRSSSRPSTRRSARESEDWKIPLDRYRCFGVKNSRNLYDAKTD